MEESHNPLVEIASEGAFDEENPQSLYNLLPPSIQENLLKTKNFLINDLSAESLRKNIVATPEYRKIRHLRTSFWREYDNAQSQGRKMQMTRIWQGITTSSGEFYKLMKVDHFAAFIFTKPVKKDVQEESLLEIAYEQMEDILLSDHKKLDGTLDAAAAKVKVEIWDKLNDRVQGSIVKKVHVQSEQKNINTNLNVSATPEQVAQINRLDEMRDKLIELREQTKDIETISHVIEEEDEQY